jgi:methionyl-tRNA formyltransferase
MKPKRVLITAGYSRAPHVHLLLDLLMEKDIEIAGLLVVTPFSFTRVRRMIRQRGISFMWESIQRILQSNLILGNYSKEDNDLDREIKNRKISTTSLRVWAKRQSIPYRTVNSVNSPVAIKFVQQTEFDSIVYGGGGILLDTFIEASKAWILNAHSGPLPFVRGMNACEWSLLLGYPVSVTVHLVDRGIDTGQILLQRDVPIYSGETIRQIRSRCTTVGMTALSDAIDDVCRSAPNYAQEDTAQHRQCFLLAPALREILDYGLAKGTFVTASNDN